jgi:CO/xanthine dehydrogenase Mo-binding subunit
MRDFELIGSRMPRIDSEAKARGTAIFAGDIRLPRMLSAAVLRSPYAHARIKSIDTSQAEALPGVKAVISGKDTAGVKWGVFRYTRDQELLPTEKVRYVGEEVAAVAAVDLDTARQALELIKVDYEPLEPVLDVWQAMAEGTTLLHDDHPNNINVHVAIDVGDVEKGFAESALVREDVFTAPEDSYFMTEPYTAVANPRPDGSLELWMPNAAPHQKAKALANALSMPLHRVIVRKCYIGGAFGGRSDVFPAEFIVGLLARETRRPVRLVYSREENSLATRKGHGMYMVIKTGMDKNGQVQARDITCYMDGGAYSSTGPIATSVPFLCMEQAYKLPSVRFNGYRVYTNKPIGGMYRVHGRAFASGVDLQMDLMAEELGLDPLQVRLINSREVGETTPTGSKVQSCGMKECIKTAAEASGWERKYNKLPKYRGIGLGTNSVQTGFPLGIRGGSASIIKFNEDGGATLISGVVDNGQGNDNMLVQIAAEVLGMDPCNIQLMSADTETTPNDPGAYSMQATFTGGNAARLAAEDARDQLFEVAAKKLGAPVENLVAAEGHIYVAGAPEDALPLAKVIRMALIKGNNIIGRGSFAPKVDHRREWIENPQGQLSETFSFGATVAEVEVDPETGQVTVLDLWLSQDCGKVLNPTQVEGQWEGGATQGGSGGVVLEEHLWTKEGRCLNPSFLEYKVPLCVDVPAMHNLFVDTLDPTGPFGAKEAGMSIAMSAAQAIVAAASNAIGKPIFDYPLTPDRVLKAMRAGGDK